MTWRAPWSRLFISSGCDGCLAVRTALADFAMNSRFAHILTTSAAIPTDCGSCALKTACFNGLQQTQSPVHRFSKKRGFDNPSLYCDGYKAVMIEMAAALVKSGNVALEELVAG